MALLERVATLIRANLNELIEKAENPEIMLKQVITDMENQFMQVKTQVAIAIADQHLLEKRQRENEEKAAEWRHKAEFAVDRKQDDLARAALERAEGHRVMAEKFEQQVIDQRAQVENLKSALQKLEQKLAEARDKRDILIAQHRRSRALGKASEAQISIGDSSKTAAFDRLKDRVQESEAVSQAKAEMAGDGVEEKLAALERDQKIERMLNELKVQRGQKG
ncbi:MAG: PspA/IM30 family protein [Acidobacteria bacterium]|nr:PspA/IM30 family protein [Acidobacteriota bacterium]